MKKPLVIFGTGQISELAHAYFSTDSNYQPVAFTVDANFRDKNWFCDLPVYDFEKITSHCPTTEHSLFVALGYTKINSLRKEKYLAAKSLGYPIASYISSHATVLNGGQFGENCFVLEDNTVQPFVTIGDNVILWSGNHIGHHSTIASHSFVSSHVVISGGVIIGEQSFLGVNATLRNHITVGPRSVIGAGATVLNDVQEGSVVKAEASKLASIPSNKLRRI